MSELIFLSRVWVNFPCSHCSWIMFYEVATSTLSFSLSPLPSHQRVMLSIVFGCQHLGNVSEWHRLHPHAALWAALGWLWALGQVGEGGLEDRGSLPTWEKLFWAHTSSLTVSTRAPESEKSVPSSLGASGCAEAGFSDLGYRDQILKGVRLLLKRTICRRKWRDSPPGFGASAAELGWSAIPYRSAH